MNEFQSILEKIKKMLLRLNFRETVISGEVNYVRGGLYCIPQYVRSLGFLIEYAGSFEEAEKHWHEDGDSFPIGMGEAAILAGLEEEVKKELSQG